MNPNRSSLRWECMHGRVTQLYMFFMVWRFQKRLEHYSGMKGPFYGGEYSRCTRTRPCVCVCLGGLG